MGGLTYAVSDIIAAAFNQIGVPNPTATQNTAALVRFNTLMTNWMAYGIDTWARRNYVVTLVAGQASYEIGPGGADVNDSRPLSIVQCYRTPSGGTDVPLFEYSKQEYYWLANKAQSGVPTQYYYDQGSPIGLLYIWPVPDASNLPMTVTADALVQFDQAGSATIPDMPDHWYEAAINNLALLLGMSLGRQLDPILAQMAQRSLDLAKGMEFEQADFFRQPDYRFSANR